MTNAFPKTQLATIGGGVVEYAVAGKGAPPIVLINGSGGPIDGWFGVCAALAELGTVFAYDRAGIGKSSKPSEAQTGDVIVRTLREVLAVAGLSGPYVLVGHSLGGLHANLFARLHPADVAGVVLLEASAPDDIALMAGGKGRFQRLAEQALDRIFGKDELGETAHAAETVALVRRAGPFPPVPLVVVTGGKPAMQWATTRHLLEGRAANQRALVQLSPRGEQIIAARSGHFPQFSEPEVVVDAVRRVIEVARGRG